MPKLKIVHKGLILVAVPLIFGIGFISVLYFGLLDASRRIDHEILLKEAITSHLSTMTYGFCATVAYPMYEGTRNLAWKKYFTAQQRRAIASDKNLRHLLRNERNLQIPSFQSTYDTIQNGAEHKAETPLLRYLQKLSSEESKSADQAVFSLRLILWCGIASGVLLSSALAIYFCLNITNRLLIIVNNAYSLSNGSALNEPFKGNDEIAELDQSLYKSATEIRELEKFKNEMVGVVSHELKSPLSSVGGFLSSLGAGVYGELTAKAQDKVNRTYNSVKRLMGLVGELLYIDRLELEMHPEEIQVDDLLAAAVDTVRELSETSGIEIKVVSCGGSLIADRNRLVQVIVNLLSNAMKFSPKDGVIKLETQFTDGWFECRVIDQGPGIPDSFRKQIFEPFKQVDATDATTKKGTGLGLTISRSIVEQHGGQIAVDSELGKGSTFWFKLPHNSTGGQTATTNNDRGQASSVAKPSMLPSSNNQNAKNKSPSGKYGVLKQGVFIIALPLVFQICFALLFNSMINGICNQIEQEHNSMQVLQSLNNCINVVTSTSMEAIANVYFQKPNSRNAFEELEKNGLAYLDSAVKLSSKNPDQIVALDKSKEKIKELADLFRQESITHESKIAFDKMDFAYRQMAYATGGLELKPSNAEEAREAEDGIGTFQMLADFRKLWRDPIHRNLSQFLKLQTYLESAMDRELEISHLASKQRILMIRQMQNTLFYGILATVVISVLIAFFLMRGITRRLQHVMQNTQLLATREKLDAPIKGNDEIAYLDNVLFETGNRLIELETFKRELVSIVSHELRTPLLSISSALEVFGTGMYGELSEKGKSRLGFAKTESNRLIRLINDLLDIEKMEAGKFILDISEVKIGELIEDATEAAAQLAEANQIKLETMPFNENATFSVDRDRICQVLINFLSNAIKYSPKGGLISIGAEMLDDGRIRCFVRDQGRGIPEEMRQQVFDRFVQVEKSDATERGGTGLGLAICKAIVEQHTGQIGVDSTVGAGSTFWFIVPASQNN